MLEQIDQNRIEASAELSLARRADLGQYMTPATVASFMASMFRVDNRTSARLLDAGAGVGSLSGAFLDRWADGGFGFRQVELVAYEIEESLERYLTHTLYEYAGQLNLRYQVRACDFVADAIDRIQFPSQPGFTHCIMNPPYKKIASNSRHRRLLRQVDIETVNIYAGFVALAVQMMEPGGQIVAIIPRSFCNGPYYRPFREFILARTAIRHIHLFGSRNSAFKDDGVLQENIIIHLECGTVQKKVIVSTSKDANFGDYAEHSYNFSKIVLPHDRENFIHIPISPDTVPMEISPVVRHSLDDLGIQVSTGPVVDFRLREHLRDMPEPGSVPLLYPVHFSGRALGWPKAGSKKPNAIMYNQATKKWLFPNGFYLVTRRFSSKEEKRRIVAGIIDPNRFPEAQALGLENHLNVFHINKTGLPEELVNGLWVYLNSSPVDVHFRQFSGHTQVNATDLRQMKYPSREELIRLGVWTKNSGELSQNSIDQKLAKLLL